MKEKSVGYGFVGKWEDGQLGWFLPNHLTATGRRLPDIAAAHPNWSNIGERSYLCKITVELVRDKLGRPIIRKVKP